jgi:predicted secreted protein
MTSFLSAFAVYFIIWWITLFLVLPFGVKSQAEAGIERDGTDPGAPVAPALGKRIVINTLVSAVIFGLGWWLVHSQGWSIRDLPSIFPQDR